ncbi:MoaF-related domain-containing protein [Maribacter halichondriae]|uniref:MoaF-related domain-containing protein n=1 Tax=Maribacter halichondriae TaxID=2980554 RepID=UPI0023594990|nr:MoaF C-terminal domain-containing protein [Maribacter sp. Hal144]
MRTIFMWVLLVSLWACREEPKQVQIAPEPKETATAENIAPIDLIGKTIVYDYGENVYHVTIDDEIRLHWEAVEGSEVGVKETETYKMHRITAQTIFITWGEANGIGVSQVLDFKKGIVYNHLLRGRDIAVGTGEIFILNN